MKSRTSEVEGRKLVVPRDEALHFAPLLDPASAIDVLRESVPSLRKRHTTIRVGHVRYSPGVGCTICYHLSTGAGETVLYVRCVDKSGYEETRRKNERQRWTAGSFLNGPVAIPEYRAVIYEFPNDGRMTELRSVATQQGLTRVVTRHKMNLMPSSWQPADREIAWEVLRYKPESRFVALCESFWRDDHGHEEAVRFLLRAERVNHADRVFPLMQQLRVILRGVAGIAVPETLFCEPNRGLTAIEFVAGTKLSELLRGDDAKDAVAWTARTLATLHRCQVTKLEARSVESDLQKAAQTASLLSHCGGSIRRRSGEIEGRLTALHESAATGYRGFVHGDFHQGQVLCDGRVQRILDFDRAHFGDTTADIGNLLAQIAALQLRGRMSTDVAWDELFLSAYDKAGGPRVPNERLRFWTAIRLFEVAAKEFRRLKANWPDKVANILNSCEEIVER